MFNKNLQNRLQKLTAFIYIMKSICLSYNFSSHAGTQKAHCGGTKHKDVGRYIQKETAWQQSKSTRKVVGNVIQCRHVLLRHCMWEII